MEPEASQFLRDFASRGIVILPPESLGIPAGIHDRVYQREKEAYLEERPVTPTSIPEVLQVLNAPGLVAVCDQLVGTSWAVVPFTHNASFTSGGRDQHWHKDDNSPSNGRKQRHHQAVQIELLYYPQAVSPVMGPTATMPYSHYWTFNHEENHDNFAGADHLDFDYFLSGMERQPASGPDCAYSADDVLHRRTAHDVRMRDAVANTQWPLVRQFEAAPLAAGSVLIYSHNTFHRGNHRRDDWRQWREQPRFMWRFWLYRTTDPAASGAGADAGAGMWAGIDPLTHVDLDAAPEDVTVLWRYHLHWLQTGRQPPPRPGAAQLSAAARSAEAERLGRQLRARYDVAEPARIGAAYQLASIGDPALAVGVLGAALHEERESVRRAATYGLVAVGPDATDTLLAAATSPVKWIRKAAVFGLGDASPLTAEVFAVVSGALASDPSVYVRSVAAGSLGCLGRRAVATGVGVPLIDRCLDALVGSLECEDNRVAMDLAQGRSIKFVRPTDDCDVCEGGSVDFGVERFARVRSAVRENALWSMVILCSHGPKVVGAAFAPVVAALRQVIRSDQNVISVGFAMDALCRLANLGAKGAPAPPAVLALRAELDAALAEAPIRPAEALVRSGVTAQAMAAT